MGFPPKIKVQALVASARHCCVCHKTARRNIEVHHIIPYYISNDNSFENAIPLCFDCHSEAGHYNNKEPKGNKYSLEELRKHRDNWYKIVAEGKVKYFDIEEYNKRYLPVFQSIDKVTNKSFSELFSNNLVAFTQAEQNEIERIFRRLILNNSALIKGEPAIGKTVYALKIAQKFKESNYSVLYHSFKYHKFSANEIVESLNNMRDENILFIIDDCHLDIENASKIKYYFVNNNSPSCFLFLSRNISSHLDFSNTFNSNFFDEFENLSLDLGVIKMSKKIENIIKKYKKYYISKNSRQYYVGNNSKIIRHVGDNLIALKAYLKLWENEETLSKIGKERMLEEFYQRQYFKLNKETINCLNIYLSLYSFEIPFETIPKYENETLKLEKDGIIFRYNNTLYFEHSKTANLYLESYYKYSTERVDKKFDNLETFIDSNLKQYLKLFENVEYPDNTHHLITHFLSKGKIYSDLLNKEIENILLKYYSKCDVNETLVFINRVSIYAPELFNFYFKKLILESKNSKKILNNEMFSFYYASYRRNLKPTGNDYIKELFHYNEICNFFNNANLTGFRQGIAFLFNLGEQNLALKLLQDSDNNSILSKIYRSNISEISHFFNSLHKINQIRGFELMNELIKSDTFYEELKSMSTNSVNLLELFGAINRYSFDILKLFSKKYQINSEKISEGINYLNIRFFLNNFQLYFELYPISTFKILLLIEDEAYINLSKKIVKYDNKSYKHITILFIGSHYKNIDEARELLLDDMIENMEKVRSSFDFNQYAKILYIMSNYYDMTGFVNEVDKQKQSVLKQKIGNLKDLSKVDESIMLLDKILPGQKKVFNKWLNKNRKH